jgi:predicted RNA polymerase sigma factor
MPHETDLNLRMTVVLKIIYLMFNEGYSSTSKESLIKKDLCIEAMRLGQMLIEHPSIKDTRVGALMALMCFQAARFNSRLDQDGNLVTLEEQDRNLWDHELVAQGNYFLENADDKMLSEYHIQAGIAACHATVSDYGSTDWSTILKLYDILLEISHSNVVALNRIVAYHKLHGPGKALQELKKIRNSKGMGNYYLFHAINGQFLLEEGKFKEAREAIESSINLTDNKVEKKHLRKKLEYAKNV